MWATSKLRLEGARTFDTTPPAAHWRRWPPVRFTERRVLAEEHHWRASRPGAVRGWNPAVLGAGRNGPLQLAPVTGTVRRLRKWISQRGQNIPGEFLQGVAYKLGSGTVTLLVLWSETRR